MADKKTDETPTPADDEKDPFAEDFEGGDEVEDVTEPAEPEAEPALEPEPEPKAETPKKKASKKSTKKSTKKKQRQKRGADAAEVTQKPKKRKPRAAGTPGSVPGGKQQDESNMRATRPVVNLDERKLTKKQADQLKKYKGARAKASVDSFFGAQIKQARKKFGVNSVFAGTKLQNLVIGIPCPSLSFEYLITQDVFPLGLIFHLNGPPGSLKSALFFEMTRWFNLCGGGGALMEVESKLSPDFPVSIIGDELENTLIIHQCDSVEDWQQKLNFYVQNFKDKMTGTKTDPGPGRTIPVVFGVDTIMGKASYETQENLLDKGYAERAFPVEALKITQFLRTFPQLIDKWPFAVILSNHLKEGQDQQGNKTRATAGGKAVNFQESFELETRIRKTRIQSADWEGKVISLKCYKNSFGPTGREIYTRCLWWNVPDPDNPEGKPKQVTVWDWDWSTVNLLSKLKGQEASNLKEVFKIQTPRTSDVENSAWSSTLGMKQEDAVSWTEMGQMIRADESLTEKIRDALGIKQRPLLQGDYLDQLEKMAEDLE